MNRNEVIGLMPALENAASRPVVLNDKPKARKRRAPTPARTTKASPDKNSANVAEVVAQLEVMEAQRKTWEEGVYRQSNLSLYSLLGECLAWLTADGQEGLATARRKALVEFYAQRGYPYNKKTPIESKVVRAVFGCIDRRIVSTYSLVIREAKRQNIEPSVMAQWIDERGGIQSIKLGRGSTEITSAQKIEQAAIYLTQTPGYGSVKNDRLSMLADADKSGTTCVLIVNQCSNGSFAVRALVRSPSALRAALTAVYCERKTDIQAHTNERKTQARIAA
jgi:hypothetical protein